MGVPVQHQGGEPGATSFPETGSGILHSALFDLEWQRSLEWLVTGTHGSAAALPIAFSLTSETGSTEVSGYRNMDRASTPDAL